MEIYKPLSASTPLVFLSIQNLILKPATANIGASRSASARRWEGSKPCHILRCKKLYQQLLYQVHNINSKSREYTLAHNKSNSLLLALPEKVCAIKDLDNKEF